MERGIESERGLRKTIENEMIRILKQNKNRVRETMDKDRYVVIYGDVETEQKDWKFRLEQQMKKIHEILYAIDVEDTKWDRELTEVRRLG